MKPLSLTQQVNAVMQQLTADIKANKIQIPSPPDIVLELQTLIDNPKASASDIAELIKLDFNLSGRLIKVANCALFGSRNHVNSVKAAIARLGLARVQSLVIGLTIAQNFIKSSTRGLEPLFQQAWQQSYQVAALSFVLAQHKTELDPEQALLAGMVHNVGTLPLLLRLNSLSTLRANPQVLNLVADVVVAKLYPSAGKLVMESWNFAPEISCVALSHRQLTEPSVGQTSLNDIVCVAYHLNALPSLATSDNEPTALVASDQFNKLWPSWQSAVTDLQSFYSEIKMMQQHITS